MIPHGWCLEWSWPLIGVDLVGDLAGGMLPYMLLAWGIHLYVFRGTRRWPRACCWFARLCQGFLVLCAATHGMAALIIFVPLYWLAALTKIAMGACAAAAAVVWFRDVLPSLRAAEADVYLDRVVERLSHPARMR